MVNWPQKGPFGPDGVYEYALEQPVGFFKIFCHVPQVSVCIYLVQFFVLLRGFPHFLLVELWTLNKEVCIFWLQL